MTLDGLLLAAGSGSRMGTPKALVHDADGASWLTRAVATLRDGGCDRVTVVLGASADEARPLLAAEDVSVVVAEDWAEGMGASLRSGLAALEATDGEAVVVALVDLPDVTAEVVRRVTGLGTDRGVLARAAYDGAPGHPVLLGRDHWAGVAATATGDRGARDYLADHTLFVVECGDLATGQDVDTRP
jgi:CTP:molybdopterin cytidylyltransferase MocA